MTLDKIEILINNKYWVNNSIEINEYKFYAF